MTWRPEEFEELGSELRRRIGSELRDEAEEVERLSELGRRRKSTLRDVAQTAMNRGDSVTITLGSRHWKGTLRAVGEDYLRLETGEFVVECSFASVLMLTERARTGGQSGRPPSATWRARLAELAADETLIRILVAGNDDIEGRIELVAIDHVEIAGPIPSYVPLDRIEAIIFVPSA